MTPVAFRETILDPGLAFLARTTGLASNDAARVLLLAIAGQESGWEARRQKPMPIARSFWQFERGGGVRGVLNHPSTAHRATQLCAALSIPSDEATVYEAMAWSDHLAVGMARFLLWSDPHPLPTDEQGSWDTYLRIWKPGAPRPETWPDRYTAAVAAINGAKA